MFFSFCNTLLGGRYRLRSDDPSLATKYFTIKLINHNNFSFAYATYPKNHVKVIVLFGLDIEVIYIYILTRTDD